MRKLLLLPAFVLLSFASFGQSQGQTNLDADAAYQKADQELNRTYQQILKQYGGKTSFLQHLKTAQQRWIQFRDAEMLAHYPVTTNPQYEYGSVYPMCYSQQMEELTRARTRQLRVWLVGIEEGDVCAGSVKTKPAK